MKKQSQIKSNWSQLYQSLKSLPSPFASKIPTVDKIIFDDVPPSQNPNAIAYVTTEDADQNGKLDSMHIVVPKLEQELNRTGVDYHSGPNIPLLMALTEVIAHEVGHIGDFKPGATDPFPGGESIAESAAQTALRESFPTVAMSEIDDLIKQATNISNNFEIIGSFIMNKHLIDLANKLDSRNHQKQADIVDSMVKGTLEKSAQAAGAIRPVGDPYTYDYNPQGDYFTVRSAPPEHPESIGARITPGSVAYQKLEKYKPAAPQQPLGVDPSHPNYVVQPITPEIHQANAVRHWNNFQKELNDLTGNLSRYVSPGMIEGTMFQEILDPAASPQKRVDLANGLLSYLSARGDIGAAKHLKAKIQLINGSYMEYLKEKKLGGEAGGPKVGKEILKELSKLGNQLDEHRNFKYSNQVDSLIKEYKIKPI